MLDGVSRWNLLTLRNVSLNRGWCPTTMRWAKRVPWDFTKLERSLTFKSPDWRNNGDACVNAPSLACSSCNCVALKCNSCRCDLPVDGSVRVCSEEPVDGTAGGSALAAVIKPCAGRDSFDKAFGGVGTAPAGVSDPNTTCVADICS
jgi:hypothetical protein